VNSATGRTAKQISVKVKAVLAKKLGYSKLKAISDTVNGSDVEIHK
jgi:hypothetical protein